MTTREQRRTLGRSRAADVAGDAGVSLVELLVTMLLIGIVGSVVVGMYTATTRAVTESTGRLDNTRVGQIGMETMSRHLRAASRIERDGLTPLDAFQAASPTSMTVFSFVGEAPSQVTYSLDGSGRLVQTTVPADDPDAAPYYTHTGASTTRVVIDRVVNSASDPLFRYYDAAGAEVDVTQAGADLSVIRSVDVALTVQTDAAGRVPPARVEQRLSPPNLGIVSQ